MKFLFRNKLYNFLSCKNCIPSLFTNAVNSCLVFSLSTPGIIMSHLFLTLSLGSGRVLTCSQFDLALFLRCCLLFALLQAASMRTSDLTQLLCGLFGRSRRACPVAKVPPKRLAPSKDCVSFVFNYTTPQMLKQTLTPNQLICEVSPAENKRSMMETLPERLQNVSLVFITHSFSSALV